MVVDCTLAVGYRSSCIEGKALDSLVTVDTAGVDIVLVAALRCFFVESIGSSGTVAQEVVGPRNVNRTQDLEDVTEEAH